MCTNAEEEQVFCRVKNFTLQEVMITLPGTAEEKPAYFDMASNYNINDMGDESVVISHRQ
jgi:hypothetical protein